MNVAVVEISTPAVLPATLSSGSVAVVETTRETTVATVYQIGPAPAAVEIVTSGLQGPPGPGGPPGVVDADPEFPTDLAAYFLLQLEM